MSVAVRDAADVQQQRVLDPLAVDRFSVARVATATLAAVFVDLCLNGPLAAIDLRIRHLAISPESPWHGLLLVPDGIGLRAVTAPFLMVVSLILAVRARTWRPVVLSAAAVVALNVTVGVMKLAVNRGMPALWQPELFAGGMAWPSGHASNIAMTMSMLVYLLGRYGGIRLNPRRRLVALGLPTGLMCSASVILGYHWLSDLVAGVCVGVLVALSVRNLDPDPRRDDDQDPVADARQPVGLSSGW